MIHGIKEIKLPIRCDERGSLVFAEEMTHIPFEIKEVAWVHCNQVNNAKSKYPTKRQETEYWLFQGVLRYPVNSRERYQNINLNSLILACISRKVYQFTSIIIQTILQH